MKNENVLCVTRQLMNAAFDLEKQYWKVTKSTIDSLPYEYHNRSLAERDFQLKQIIPYAIVQNNKGELLCYQRHGSEKRLTDFYSVGIGGHVNDLDMGQSLSECLISGLCREFQEETGLTLTSDSFELIGMINEEESEVGHCHTGFVFLVRIESSDFSFDTEIKNPQWVRLENVDFSKFELWSRLALNLISSIYNFIFDIEYLKS